MIEILQNRILTRRILQLLLVIIYAVGIGCILSGSLNILELTFVNLSISGLIITTNHIFHESIKKVIIFILLIFASGIAVEMIGTNTGLLFGEYEYGCNLGPKIYNTPIIIGLNWFIVTYVCGCFANKYFYDYLTKILVAASLMVLLDFLIEPVAPKVDFWYWGPDQNMVLNAPLLNYVMWAILALLYQIIFQRFYPYLVNSVAELLLYIQYGFFIILNLVL